MVEPPVVEGAENDMSMYASPAVATTDKGALGVPAMADTVDDDDPIPYSFSAAI